MIQLLRTNVGLFVTLVLLVIGGLVLSLVAYFMRARGLSLKPVWWFAGFLLLIIVPRMIGLPEPAAGVSIGKRLLALCSFNMIINVCSVFSSMQTDGR